VTRLNRLIAILVVLVVATLIYLHNRITLPDMEAKIAKQIPPGTELQRVLGFLDTLSTEHAGLVRTNDDVDFKGESDVVFAAIRDLRRGNPLAEGVFIKFRFNSAGRLTDHRVRYVYTGP
jgi:hypothetical protein